MSKIFEKPRNTDGCSLTTCRRYYTLSDVFCEHWVTSLCLSVPTWQHISGSILSHVLACCLTAPSHYLNHYWLIIEGVNCSIHMREISVFINSICIKCLETPFKLLPHLGRANELICNTMSDNHHTYIAVNITFTKRRYFCSCLTHGIVHLAGRLPGWLA